MAAYSEAGSPIAISDGRYYVLFYNPNGTYTKWFSNQSTVITDPNFVPPPDGTFSNIQVAAQTPLAQLQQLIDTGKQLAATAGPVVPFDQYMEIKNQQIATTLANQQKNNPTITSTNTTNGAPTTNVNGGNSSDPIWGLFGDSSPQLISSIPVHEYTLIGIAVAIGLVFMMSKGGR